MNREAATRAVVSAERIEKGLWWEKPWGLVNGCTPVSEGCVRCWSARVSSMGVKELTRNGRFTGEIWLRRDQLDVPGRRRIPTVYALWNDLFHEKVPMVFVCDAMRVMWGSAWHTYIVLTKRAGRMLSAVEEFLRNSRRDKLPANIWMGVTAENQARAEERLPVLRETPAAIRVVSVEPMLGPVDLSKYLTGDKRLGWVLCGGESGPGARPMHPDWPRSLRDQCQAAGVPFFFKQWGEWSPEQRKGRPLVGISPAGLDVTAAQATMPGDAWMYRIGKWAAGHILDGQRWLEFPAAAEISEEERAEEG